MEESEVFAATIIVCSFEDFKCDSKPCAQPQYLGVLLPRSFVAKNPFGKLP